ncbi:MAG: hypothetical protein ACRD44_19840 [Bryobacteraceae bacterium]
MGSIGGSAFDRSFGWYIAKDALLDALKSGKAMILGMVLGLLVAAAIGMVRWPASEDRSPALERHAPAGNSIHLKQEPATRRYRHA